MPSKQGLMGSSAPASLASKLGADFMASFTAAGSSQATATLLTGNFANVTTSSIGAGVILGNGVERFFIYNSGPNTLLVYPAVGGTIIGLALNAALNVASGSTVTIEGDGLNLLANVGI